MLLALFIFSYFGLTENLFGIENNWFEEHPTVFTLGNNTHSLPFHRVCRVDPFYPSFSLGTEFFWKNGKHGQLLQMANLGGFYHKYSAQGIYLSADIAYRYTAGFGLFTDIGLGLGYLHIFHPGAVYEIKSGKYQQVRDWGSPRALLEVVWDIGYDFSARYKRPLRFFIRYRPFLFLYRPEFPAINTNTQIGISLFMRQPERTK